MPHAPPLAHTPGPRPARDPVGQGAVLTDMRPQAAAQSALARHVQAGPRMTAQRRSLRSAFGGRAGVIQCFGVIRWANLDTSQAENVTKADQVRDSLLATPAIAAFLNNKNALITLEFDSQLASVRIDADQVKITLSPWFFEQQTAGRILGMLAHEFGAHPLAKQAMTGAERLQETNDINANTAFPTGIHGHNITPAQAGQTDHVFAAVAGQPRFREYQQTALQVATAIWNQTQALPPTMTAADVTEMIMTYLSDIAMILATNDHRGQILTSPKRTADIFNLERARWLAMLGGLGTPAAAALANLTPPTKGMFDVLGEAGSMLGSVVASVATSSRDDSNFQQGGGVLTPIQQQVMTDYALTMPAVGGIPQPTLFEALDATGLFVNSRNDALNAITLYINGLAHNHPDRPRAVRIRAFIQNTPNLHGAVDLDFTYMLRFALATDLRIIMPDGKILGGNNAGGPPANVAFVANPAPHYRRLQ